MSASRRPTRQPARANAIVRFVATELLPTPPLPLMTRTTFLPPGRGSSALIGRAASWRGGAGGGVGSDIDEEPKPRQASPSTSLANDQELPLGHLLDGESHALAAESRIARSPIGHRVDPKGRRVVDDQSPDVKAG